MTHTCFYVKIALIPSKYSIRFVFVEVGDYK